VLAQRLSLMQQRLDELEQGAGAASAEHARVSSARIGSPH
jgi:hypothetical protein